MLFKPQLFIFLEEEIRQNLTASSLALQSICLVPRAQCSFRRIKLSGHQKKFLQAAELRVRQESDSSENKFIIRPDAKSNKAGVWGFKTHAQHDGRYLPESLAFEPMHDGVRVIALSKGYEGQAWEEGSIVASRWWLNPPEAKNWASFLHSFRGVENKNYQGIPEAQKLPYRTNFPIFEIDKARLVHLFSPRNIASVISLGLVCSALFISGQYFRNVVTLKSVEADIFELSTITSQISSDRRRALSNIDQVKKHSVIGHSGTVLLGLGDIGRVLDGKGLLVERLSLNSGVLEAQLRSSAEIDVPALVMVLESQPSLANVSIAFGARDIVTLRSDLISPYDYDLKLDGRGG